MEKNRIDIWTCLNFKILPTDDRFLKLLPEQKILLFIGALELPTLLQMKYAQEEQNKKAAITEKDEAGLHSLGYSRAKINKIKEELRKAGLME